MIPVVLDDNIHDIMQCWVHLWRIWTSHNLFYYKLHAKKCNISFVTNHFIMRYTRLYCIVRNLIVILIVYDGFRKQAEMQLFGLDLPLAMSIC